MKEGFKITKVEFKFAAGNRNPFMAELKLGEETLALEAADITNTTLLKDDLNITQFSLANNQFEGAAATQIWIEFINITYVVI